MTNFIVPNNQETAFVTIQQGDRTITFNSRVSKLEFLYTNKKCYWTTSNISENVYEGVTIKGDFDYITDFKLVQTVDKPAMREFSLGEK